MNPYYEDREARLRHNAPVLPYSGPEPAYADELRRRIEAVDSVGNPPRRTRMFKTKGLSPKLFGPIVPPLTIVLGELAETGHLDRPSLKLIVVGIIGGLATYLLGPGEVVPTTAPAA